MGRTKEAAGELAVMEQPGSNGTALVAADEIEQRAVVYLEAMGLTNNLTEPQRRMFVEISKAFGLNPFKREVYAVPYWNSEKQANDISILVGYEVYLRRGEMSNKLRGWKVWTEGHGREMKACIEIRRADWDEPFTWEVHWDEFAQMRWDKKSGAWVYTKFWKTKPRTMIKKVVISTGFRLCFPVECGLLPYSQEEGQSDSTMTIRDLGDAENINASVSEEKETFMGAAPAPKVDPQPQAQEPEPKPPAATEEPPVSDQPPPEENQEPSSEKPATLVPRTGLESSQDMRQEVLLAISDNGIVREFTEFMVAKKWLAVGKTLEDLTDGQLVRLYRNWSTLWDLFTKWNMNHYAKAKGRTA